MAVVFYLTAHRTVPVEIRRRRGTRHMRLSIGHQNQIVASVPWRCPERTVMRFVETNEMWLRQQLATTPVPMTMLQWLRANPWLSASGDWFHVRVEPRSAARPGYRFENGGADVVFTIPRGESEALLPVVRRFAKDALNCRVAYHLKRLRIKARKLSIRDQSCRWGSCSSNRDISLNWRLILLSPELQDYVILHEIAHLTEMNHSARFWRLLDRYDSGREAHEAELDRVTAQIMRVGRKPGDADAVA